MTNIIHYLVHPGGKMQGTLRVPGDKSISHRSIIFGSLASGTTEVTGFLEGEDALATMNAFRAMGVHIEGPDQGRVTIHGVGLHGLTKPEKIIDCGNSGTTMRLLSGLLSAQKFDTVLTGDASLQKRPMRRVADPLAQMNAHVKTTDTGRPPLEITGNAHLKGIHYAMPVASAQVKSALLLAGLYAEGETTVVEPAPTRDHTERMLTAFGYPVEVSGAHREIIRVRSGGTLTATNIEVPADISSAAFFMVAAAITPDSDVILTHVGLNPTRTGVIDILKQMGADLTIENQRLVGGEPVGDIHIRYAPLHGIHIPEALVPLAIDEFPALFIAAANATGETILTGAEELRVKESDRIQVMADGLNVLGIQNEVLPDGIKITGQPAGGYRGGEILTHHDHRIAMSFAIAALRAHAPILIRECQNIATSFPTFWALAQTAGLVFEQTDCCSAT